MLLLESVTNLTATIITASVSAFVAVLTILTKDFWFPILVEKRISETNKKQTFEKYANPIILSSIALLYRIQEIFYRGNFLRNDAPKNFYNDYKYISSIYRLLVLIAWIRASKIELSNIEVKKNDDYKLIDSAIAEFEKSLADGQDTEQSILEYLMQNWKLDNSKIIKEDRRKLGVEIENIVDQFCYKENVEIASLLKEETKKELAKTVCHLICNKISCSKIEQDVINETLKTSIKEMSRIEAWIFRDWQSALGDMMLKRSPNDTGRKFDVIGFKEFELIFFSEDPENKKWIERINKLFKNLDVSIEDRFDSRTQQFKNVYKATYNLLEAYTKIRSGDIDLANDTLSKLREL